MHDALMLGAIMRKAILYKALFPETPMLEARAKHKTAHISVPKRFPKVLMLPISIKILRRIFLDKSRGWRMDWPTEGRVAVREGLR